MEKSVDEQIDALSRQVANADIQQVKRVLYAAYYLGLKNALLPDSIQEALNSGDGVYRP